jgi:phage shock protein A
MRGDALPSGGVSGTAAPATPASTPEPTPEKPIGQ